MASSSDSHVCASTGPAVRLTVDGSADGGSAAWLRALVGLVDDITLDRDEPALIRSALAHVVGALDLAGAVVFVLGVDGGLVVAAGQGVAAEATAVETAQAVLAAGAPVERSSVNGWLAGAALRGGSQRTLGVLVVEGQPGSEGRLPAEVLEVIGRQLGSCLENVRAHGELRAVAARAAVLQRITAAATSGCELKAVLPAFAAEMRAVVEADRLACGFVNESGDYIEMVGHPEGSCWGLGGVLPIVGSGPGFVALNDRPVVQPDLAADRRFLEDVRLLDDGLRSYVLLPLRAREHTIGVLALGSRREAAFGDAALASLQPLADAAAVAFDNVRLLQRTREMSITDEVTPLHNFRYFHTSLDRELKLVNRHGGVLSLLFIDLDQFKPINDSYGHLRGSRTLREVGFLIRAAVRETDIPARYGGDEFVVVLPHTDGPSARVLAEKLRRLIEAHTFLQEESINARLGVSLGIASYPTDASTKEALIRLADARMYEDKESRRTAR